MLQIEIKRKLAVAGCGRILLFLSFQVWGYPGWAELFIWFGAKVKINISMEGSPLVPMVLGWKQIIWVLKNIFLNSFLIPRGNSWECGGSDTIGKASLQEPCPIQSRSILTLKAEMWCLVDSLINQSIFLKYCQPNMMIHNCFLKFELKKWNSL